MSKDVYGRLQPTRSKRISFGGFVSLYEDDAMFERAFRSQAAARNAYKRIRSGRRWARFARDMDVLPAGWRWSQR